MLRIWQTFQPKAALSEGEQARGLRMMTWQAVAGSGADGLASGGFLAAFALILGASNLQIGMMTAIPSIMQPLQLLAVVMVERMRLRKLIAVSAYFIAYSSWIPVAAIPFLMDVPSAPAVSAMLALTAVRGAANAFVNSSWMSWIRDVVPQAAMGNFFAHRLRMATIVAAAIALAAALYIDTWKRNVPPDQEVLGYSYAMLFGALVLGWAAVAFMARMPEPLMAAPAGPRLPVRKMLAMPFKDRDFRGLMYFLLINNFALHLAVPFFAVYMLVRLEMSLSLVVGLGVLSQVSNVLFLRVWGPLVDRYGSKSTLSMSTSLYMLCILGWAFTTLPGRYFLTMPLLVVLHIFIGIASAGINISTTTIRLKMAPQAYAAAYMTGSSLAANLGAGVGPLVGGLLADFFQNRQLQAGFSWIAPSGSLEFPVLHLTGFDFLFAIAFLIGIATLNILAGIREEGAVDREVVLEEMMVQTRNNLRTLISMPGMGLVSHFPHVHLGHIPRPRVPGLDVAVGVTAYELASTTRSAVLAVSRGTATVSEVSRGVSHTLSKAVERLESIGEHGVHLASHATRGAIHAADEAGLRVGHMSRAAVIGAVDALGKTSEDAWDALWGAGYGVIRGADETGADMAEAVSEAVGGARQAAREMGLSEDEAAGHVARGAMEAAGALGPGTLAKVKEAILSELLDIGPAGPEGDSDDRQKPRTV